MSGDAMPRGNLYLVPVALGEHTPWAHFLPAQAQAIAAGLRHFVVETARAARAHLKQLDYPHPLRDTDIRELPAEAADAALDALLAPRSPARTSACSRTPVARRWPTPAPAWWHARTPSASASCRWSAPPPSCSG